VATATSNRISILCSIIAPLPADTSHYYLHCSSIMTLAESNDNNVVVALEQEYQAAVGDGVPQPPKETEPMEVAAFEPAPEKKKSFMEAATSDALRPFVIISSSYLLFTITDGAIRMIVLLHAYTKKFSAFEVAVMFTLYELAGVFTNLVSGFNRRIKVFPTHDNSIQLYLHLHLSFDDRLLVSWAHGGASDSPWSVD
jgi:hypothetical protein